MIGVSRILIMLPGLKEICGEDLTLLPIRIVMLQILREKANRLITVVVLLIVVAFVFFGFGDFFIGGSSERVAAKVGRTKILWQTVDSIAARITAQQQGGEVDKKALRQKVLTNLIQQMALVAAAKEHGFEVSDAQIAEALYHMPYFQVDGKFSKEKYLKVLSEAHYTDKEYRTELSDERLLAQFAQGLMQTSFATENELKNLIALFDQKRDFGFFVVPKEKYTKYVKISPDEVKTYYEKHKSTFIKPETVTLQFVELSLGDLSEKIKLTNAEIEAYYEEHKAAYTLPERVHARHILVLADEDPKSDSAAKSKIEAITNEIKGGASFESVAKRESEDPGSAEQGGDLGWFTRGQMVPEFEKVAFELQKPGELKSVKTQYGYHLLQLVEHKNPEVRLFPSVKHLVEAQLKRERAEKTFAEQAELFAKLGFEHSDSLTPIAEQFGLKIEQSVSFSRTGGEGIAKNPTVLKAAFSEVLLAGKNSDPIQLGDNRTVIIRVKEHKPAVQETFAESEKKIEDILVAERVKLAAKDAGEKIIQEIEKGKTPHQLAKLWNLAWIQKNGVSRSAENMDQNILSMAFQLRLDDTHHTKPILKGAVLPNGDYVVLALEKVILGDWTKLDPEKQKAYRQNLEGIFAQLEYLLYVGEVLEKAKVKIADREA